MSTWPEEAMPMRPGGKTQCTPSLAELTAVQTPTTYVVPLQLEVILTLQPLRGKYLLETGEHALLKHS